MATVAYSGGDQPGTLTLRGLTSGRAQEGVPIVGSIFDADGDPTSATYTFWSGSTLLQTGFSNTYTPGPFAAGQHITVSAAYTDGLGYSGSASADAGIVLNTLTLRVSEDYFAGDAKFTVTVDGVQVGGIQTVMAVLHPTTAVPGYAVTTWGDSLTQGTVGAASSYPTYLSGDLGRPVANKGVAGETSTQILTRFEAARATWSDATVLWAGRNDYENSPTVVSNVNRMVSDLQSVGNNDYLVLGVLNGLYQNEFRGGTNYNKIVALNNNLSATFGAHYVDIRSYLVSLYDRASPIDVVDYGLDTVPSSLHVVLGKTSLSGALSSTSTAFTVTGGLTLKAGMILTIDGERIYLQEVAGNSVLSSIRGSLGTTASAHAQGASAIQYDNLHLNAVASKAVADYVANALKVEESDNAAQFKGHSYGGYQDITLAGDFSSVPRTVAINFINDASGGTASTDRNLIVNSLTVNGQVFSADSASNPGGVRSGADAVIATNAALTFDTSRHTLTVRASEDAYLGDAKFVVLADGKQIGGVQTVTALHSAGQYQDIAIDGLFGPTPGSIAIKFINDASGGSPDKDRNLYIDKITLDGVVFEGELAANTSGPRSTTDAVLAINGAATFSTAAAQNSITVRVAEDAYLGDAKFVVLVDGRQVGPVQTATTWHGAGWQDVTIQGDFSPTPQTVSVQFINDASGGSADKDRNLYVDSLTIRGKTFQAENAQNTAGFNSATDAGMFINGDLKFDLSTPLTVRVAEDAYRGDAQFVVLLDGRQIGSVQTATALHSAHGWQDISVAISAFATPATVGVRFVNDLYGGTPDTDRNLYVDKIIFGGRTFEAETAFNPDGLQNATEAVLASNSTVTFDTHMLFV